MADKPAVFFSALTGALVVAAAALPRYFPAPMEYFSGADVAHDANASPAKYSDPTSNASSYSSTAARTPPFDRSPPRVTAAASTALIGTRVKSFSSSMRRVVGEQLDAS